MWPSVAKNWIVTRHIRLHQVSRVRLEGPPDPEKSKFNSRHFRIISRKNIQRYQFWYCKDCEDVFKFSFSSSLAASFNIPHNLLIMLKPSLGLSSHHGFLLASCKQARRTWHHFEYLKKAQIYWQTAIQTWSNISTRSLEPSRIKPQRILYQTNWQKLDWRHEKHANIDSLCLRRCWL